MHRPTFVVHGHFYQPPRENPWTEVVAAEPSAAPFHDWNERVTGEAYRPNGWARIVDERDRVVAIVDNYAHLGFDLGPTLASWLAEQAPDVLARMVEGDRAGGGAIAQAYNHVILPLANERDVRTQVRWGLTDFLVDRFAIAGTLLAVVVHYVLMRAGEVLAQRGALPPVVSLQLGTIVLSIVALGMVALQARRGVGAVR